MQYNLWTKISRQRKWRLQAQFAELYMAEYFAGHFTSYGNELHLAPPDTLHHEAGDEVATLITLAKENPNG